MTTMLFRQEVIEAGRDRLVGTINAATPPRSRIYFMLALVALAALLLLLVFGNFASKIRVSGILSYSAGVTRIYPPSPVEIRQLMVREGSIVRAGAPVAVVAVTQGRDATGDGVQSQLAELTRQDTELARQQDMNASLGRLGVDALVSQRAGLVEAIAALQRQIALSARRVQLGQKEAGRTARLATQGAASTRQSEDAAAASLQQQLDVEALKGRLIDQQAALRNTDVLLAQARVEAAQKHSQISGQRAAIAGQRAALSRLDRLVLTAPTGGRVDDLVAAIGQRAEPATSLMTIAPVDARLEVWLYAPSRAIGQAHPGQQVRLMFDAFPPQTFGAGTGTVTEISNVPTDPGAIAAGLDFREPVYRVRVRIDRLPPQLSIGRLRGGMTLAANMITERRHLWELFLEPVLKAWRQ
jgi:membrane fusion protein